LQKNKNGFCCADFFGSCILKVLLLILKFSFASTV
jgi:hypothetical protein